MCNRIGRRVVTRFFFAAAVMFGGALYAGDELKLRVNDAMGVPGGLAAVVVRTYASSAIGQGQLCLDVEWNQDEGYADRPFVSLERVVTFSGAGDAYTDATFDELSSTQPTMVSFESPSGSINANKGPMVVLFFRLDPNLAPGRKFGIEFVEDQSYLLDSTASSVPVKLVGGRLTIRDPASLYVVAAQNDRVSAGEPAGFGVETFEPLGLSSGRLAIRYDVTVTRGRPAVAFDPRYGNAVFTVEDLRPGLVVVSFVSPLGAFNTVPGEIVSVSASTVPGVKAGAVAPVSIDPELSYLVDALGTRLVVDYVDGELRFR